MIVGLGVDFWVSLCWVGVLFLAFCFLSGCLESVVAVLPVLLLCPAGVHRECLLVLEAGMQRQVRRDDGLWDAQMWGGCSWCSVAALGMRLRNWVLGNRES